MRFVPSILTHGLLRALLATVLACVTGDALAQEQTWKINLKNADINEFVSQIAAITGKTFVVDPRVKGKVTVISNASLNEHDVYELFLSVLRVHGFAAIETSGVVRVQQNTLAKQSGSPLDDAKDISGEDMVTRVIAAQYVDSNELVKTLRPMIPQYGNIAAISNPNVVIISDHAENVVRLMRLIEKIDVPGDERVVVVALKDAWVGNIVELLQKLAPEQLGQNAKGPQSIQIIANERNNSLVLRGKTRPIAEIQKLIAELDQPATERGATQVVYLSHADAKNVAEILRSLITGASAGAGSGGGGGGGAATVAVTSPTKVNIQADESLNALVIRADPSDMGEIMDIVQGLDVRRTQVLIEAAIVEISVDNTLNYGVDFAAIDRDGTTPIISTALSPALATIVNALNGATDANGNPIPPIAAAAAVTTPTLAAIKLDANGFSFAAVLQAIATSSNANLLSTPSILTLDNEEAKILVGQEVPFRTGSYTTNTTGADNPFTTIQRKDVGLTLTVTPHIHDGKVLRLEVAQEVSNIVPASLATSTNALADVVTNKRTINTTVLAEDRQTIALGGLIEDDITDTKKKVPLLGDIPWLGKLFQNVQKERVKRNLLVFLRPTVLRTQEDAAAATERKYEKVWEVHINGDDEKSHSVPLPPLDSIYDGRQN
ncbi:MAG TPA: type II secretion system secretin GspD [Pseudomonadales bacterium]|nr:type II secretion system secretin GspD [Pseudomonadales bacterium]